MAQKMCERPEGVCRAGGAPGAAGVLPSLDMFIKQFTSQKFRGFTPVDSLKQTLALIFSCLSEYIWKSDEPSEEGA